VLFRSVSSMAPGSQVNLRVNRNGEPRNVTVTLGELPPPKETAAAQSSSRQKPSPAETPQSRLGVAVTNLTPDLAQHLEVPSTVKGVVVADVEDGSPAAEAGLIVGDVVQEVNKKPVHNVNEFQAALPTSGSEPVLLSVNRSGHTLFFALKRS